MRPRRLFLLAYLLSGAAALMYQVTWSRLLTLHLGNTVAAVGTVLAAFMGGLALGAGFAGRRAPGLTRERALLAYGVLEVGIAAAGLLVPFAIAAFTPLLRAAYLDGAGAWFGLVRGVTALALITAPGAAMGATLPFAVRWYVADAQHAGSEGGALYTVNTVGAVIGTILAGFVLLPAVGLYGTTAAAVALNVGAAWIAVRLSRMPITSSDTEARPIAAGRTRVAAGRSSGPHRQTQSPRVARLWLAAAALCVSGFVALVYEVVWTRLFALVVGPTTYAFSAMLVAFIGGLAIGAALASHYASRSNRPEIALATALAATAVGALGVSTIVTRMPLIVGRMVAQPDVSFTTLLFAQGLAVAVLLLPMTCALGAAFPIAVRLATDSDELVSRDVSIVYTLNTVGAIAGALAGSFLLVPALGLERSLDAAAIVGLAGAGVVLIVSRPPLRAAALPAVLMCAGVLLVVMAPGWDRMLLSSGAYKYAAAMAGADLEAGLSAGTLLYYREGATATVSVRRNSGALSLAIDGKVDASDAGDMLTQKLIAHLPLLLHEKPRTAAIIGVGSGVTVGSALRHPVERVDVIEISPEVVEASRLFSRVNYNGLSDPRTRLIVGDGRSHLMLTRDSYDVIISEPSNPWMAGVANLFTREFFASVKERLAPGGVFCQWAHAYDISAEDLRAIVATFLAEFPHGTLWRSGESDLLLIAAEQAIDARLPILRAQLARRAVMDDLRLVEANNAFSLLSLFGAGPGDLRKYAEGARIETDARLALEFSAPRHIYRRDDDNQAELRALVARAARPRPVAAAIEAASSVDWLARGNMHLRARSFVTAYDDFERALALDPMQYAAYEGLARAAAGSGRARAAIARLRSASQGDTAGVAARVVLSRLLFTEGDIPGALAAAEDAVKAAPVDLRAREQLASVFADAGDPEQLRAAVAEMRKLDAAAGPTRYYHAASLFMDRHFADAIEEAARISSSDPLYSKARNLIGAAWASLGQAEKAREALTAALATDPTDVATLLNAGQVELGAGDAAAAARYFADALIVGGVSDAARSGLADALEQQGHAERARRLRAQN